MQKIYVKRQILDNVDGKTIPYRGGEHWVDDEVAKRLLSTGNAVIMESTQPEVATAQEPAQEPFVAGSWPGKRLKAEVADDEPKAPKTRRKAAESQAEEAN